MGGILRTRTRQPANECSNVHFAARADILLTWSEVLHFAQRNDLAPGSRGVGQCLEDLCGMKEVHLPRMSAALKEKPDSPVEGINSGKQA